jgi:predicted O-methyltransferase YrrM
MDLEATATLPANQVVLNELAEGEELKLAWAASKRWLKRWPVFRTLAGYRRQMQKAGMNAASSVLLTGGGISIEEIYFFENLLSAIQPKNEFLVGIAAGWSTIAFGLITPSARLYAIDNLSEGAAAAEGLRLTREIAQKRGILLETFIGSSPQDVPKFLAKTGQKMDFAFIDGLHTDEQMYLDFEATVPYMAPACAIAFHDVLNWKMHTGWKRIVNAARGKGFRHRLLRRTTSGIGLLYRDLPSAAEAVVLSFSQDFKCPL